MFGSAAAPPCSAGRLAGWLGVAFDPALPAAHRREWLKNAEPMARWHGTRRGLLLALNIATSGQKDWRDVLTGDGHPPVGGEEIALEVQKDECPSAGVRGCGHVLLHSTKSGRPATLRSQTWRGAFISLSP